MPYYKKWRCGQPPPDDFFKEAANSQLAVCDFFYFQQFPGDFYKTENFFECSSSVHSMVYYHLQRAVEGVEHMPPAERRQEFSEFL